MRLVLCKSLHITFLGAAMQAVHGKIHQCAWRVCLQRPARTLDTMRPSPATPAKSQFQCHHMSTRVQHVPCASATATGRHTSQERTSDTVLCMNIPGIRFASPYDVELAIDAGGDGDESDDDTEASRQQLSRCEHLTII